MPERLSSLEVPLPNSKLMLIDLDKTLIDAKYNFTDDSIFEEIVRVKLLGWQLGLSSDSPLESLKNIRNYLGLNGPIIAERGSVVWLPNGKEFPMIEAEEFFNTTRRLLVNKLAEDRRSFYYGDATQFVANRPILPNMLDNKIILIQAHRKCGLCLYGMSIDNNGSLVIDNELTEQTIQLTKSLMPNPPFTLNEDFNKGYGIYILSPDNVNKRKGSLTLLQNMNLSKIGMIGDSSSDILGNDIAFHYAVGNAKPELKTVANYVSNMDYTSGVIDILKLIRQ
ncbi:MAG: HAD hydrolase family protein [bacterium]|nr:HAD hydrolase family protein [bacterium]